jgi:hypothetical protein
MSWLDRFGDLVMHSDTEDIGLSPTVARAVQSTTDIRQALLLLRRQVDGFNPDSIRRQN